MQQPTTNQEIYTHQILKERIRGWSKRQTIWEMLSYIDGELSGLEDFVDTDEDGQPLTKADTDKDYTDGKVDALLSIREYVQAIADDCKDGPEDPQP